MGRRAPDLAGGSEVSLGPPGVVLAVPGGDGGGGDDGGGGGGEDGCGDDGDGDGDEGVDESAGLAVTS